MAFVTSFGHELLLLLTKILHVHRVVSIALLLTNSIHCAILRVLGTLLSGKLGSTEDVIRHSILNYLLVLSLTWTEAGRNILLLLLAVLLRGCHVDLLIEADLASKRS